MYTIKTKMEIEKTISQKKNSVIKLKKIDFGKK